MANCIQCGAEQKDDSRFCTECGAATPPPAPAAPVTPAPQAFQAQAAPPSKPAPPSDAPPPGSKYELISTGGYIGIMLLMCIPILGQLLMIIWACGGCRKLQKRNLARASLIMLVVTLLLGALLGFALKKAFDAVVDGLENSLGITTEDGAGSLLTGLLGGSGTEGNGNALSGLLGGDTNALLGGLLNGGELSGVDQDALKQLMKELEGLAGSSAGLS